MLPHIDMGGYKGKVRKISGKVHFFLDVSSEMLFEVCRIYGFVSLLAHPSSFLVIVLACPCSLFLACPSHYSAAVFILCTSNGTMLPAIVVAIRGRGHRWSPPRDYDSSKMCLLACVYARPSAISHFLLSQPSHASSFLLPFVDRNEGVTTKNVGDFLKNLPRFSDYLPRFFLLLRLSSKSLLLSRKTCCFVPFQLLQFFSPFAPSFSIFSRLAALKYKRMFIK